LTVSTGDTPSRERTVHRMNQVTGCQLFYSLGHTIRRSYP